MRQNKRKVRYIFDSEDQEQEQENKKEPERLIIVQQPVLLEQPAEIKIHTKKVKRLGESGQSPELFSSSEPEPVAKGNFYLA